MNKHKLAMLQSSQECDWRTPPECVEGLKAAFPALRTATAIDLAATAESAVIEFEGSAVYLGPDHPDAQFRNALAVPWHRVAEWGFLNPTYSLSLYSDGLKNDVPREELAFLLIENWARKAWEESLRGFHTVGVFPYSPQTEWFREWALGHSLTVAKANKAIPGWSGHAAIDVWRIPHRVDFLRADGTKANNANVNTCVIHWGPNPGFQGPWLPDAGRYWSYRKLTNGTGA